MKKPPRFLKSCTLGGILTVSNGTLLSTAPHVCARYNTIIDIPDCGVALGGPEATRKKKQTQEEPLN